MLAQARARGSTISHPSGSCMMAAATVGRGRPRLARPRSPRPARRRRLDHADVVSGNTNAACIMIGEKCADLMLAVR
jgi:choline dehydrogenase